MTEELPEFETPEYLQLSPEKLAENEARQKEWARGANPANLMTSAYDRNRAAQIEADARRVIGILREQISNSIESETTEQLNNALQRELSRLAEALALQGRFDEAAHSEPDVHKTNHYEKLHAAVFADDTVWCDCPKTETLPSGEKREVRQSLGKIYSQKHNSEKYLIVCSKCNFYNVRDLPKKVKEGREK